MSAFVVTLDLDWACEPAIAFTLDSLLERGIRPTVFATHRSSALEAADCEVGVHPYFSSDSSHGSTIDEVVEHMKTIPHNLPAFRCHRFANGNASRLAMMEAGFSISSNVCTDLESLPLFRDRFGMLEVPIFLEDGGYLWRQHPLHITDDLRRRIMGPDPKVILIHPMHFILNTPSFPFMTDIKGSVDRDRWRTMTDTTLHKLRWSGRGIRDFLLDLLNEATEILTFGELTARYNGVVSV